MSKELKINYEFCHIKFDKGTETHEPAALASGWLNVGDVKGRFGIALAPRDDGEWSFRDSRADDIVASLLREQDVLQALVNKCAELLKTINMWPESGEPNNPARLTLNQIKPPAEVTDRVIVSFRSGMLSLPMDQWDDLWNLIEQRVENDQYFRVNGFERHEICDAITNLKNVFPASWVRARYKHTVSNGQVPKLAADLSQDDDGWFPAYQLARSALGAICIDPGWNYLVEIGTSIGELTGFDGLKTLLQQLARSTGSQHHLCLAAELYRRGHLIALEQTGGSGRNDLLVECNGNQYDIEVKEFSSKDPAARLMKEITTKQSKLPRNPERPMIFHAVLVENGVFEKEKEDKFFDAVAQMTDSLPDKISAVVAGRRFVDSSGGRVKRDVAIQILNSKAQQPATEKELNDLFETNYDHVHYPIFGIGSFFSFDVSKPEPES